MTATGSSRDAIARLACSFVVGVFLSGVASAQEKERPYRATLEYNAESPDIPTLRIIISPSKLRDYRLGQGGELRNECTKENKYTDAKFDGGRYIVQAGFAEREIAATSYALNAEAFPVTFRAGEQIFATSNSKEETTTQWSFLLFDGNPDQEYIVLELSSLQDELPAIVIPAGTKGVNARLEVDESDPEQIQVTNETGQLRISIGYRIDQHNQQDDDPCFVGPPTCCNAFPTTDTSGLKDKNNNWLYGVDCGDFGCPANGGWSTFGKLASYCRPSGDWVQRVFYEPADCAPASGACCLTDGTCEQLTQTDCDALSGTYQGDATNCNDVSCPAPEGACCFESTGDCLDWPRDLCDATGGVYKGEGIKCQDIVCFAKGACCLPDGSCLDDQSPEDCATAGGDFQGDAVACADVSCPQPTGSCCYANQFCADLTSDECAKSGGSWSGMGTTCDFPAVTLDPVDQTVCEGDGVAFTVKACGKKTVTYQWTKNGQDIGGATKTTYVIPVVGAGDAATYRCRVKANNQETLSEPANLSVTISCDSNCDGSVDFNDIDQFIVALIDQAEWESSSSCDYLCVNDSNRDGTVDFNDIDSFVECLIK